MPVNLSHIDNPQLKMLGGRLPNGREQLSKLLNHIVRENHFPIGLRFDSLNAIREQARLELFADQRINVVVSVVRSMALLVELDPNFRHRLQEQGTFEYKVMMKLCHELSSLIGDLSSNDLAIVAQSLAFMGFRHEGLFGAISSEFQKKYNNPSSVQLSQLAESYALLDIKDIKLTSFLGKAARALQRTPTNPPFTMRSRSTIGWSLAFLDPAQVPSVINSRFLMDDKCEIKDWRRIYQALIVTDAITPLEYFPRRKEAWNMRGSESSNSFERSVKRGIDIFLKNMPHAIEEHSNVAGVLIDFVLYLEHRTIAIECDGYHYHYSTGPDGGRLFGRDLMQDQVLKRCGMEVIHISSYEWNDYSASQILSDKLGIPQQ